MIVPVQDQVIVNPKTGKRERIFVNLEAVYPNPDVMGTEMSFEELRAQHRGWLDRTWSPEKVASTNKNGRNALAAKKPAKENVDAALPQSFNEKLQIARDPVMLDENGAVKEPARTGRSKKIKVMELNETQISEYSVLP